MGDEKLIIISVAVRGINDHITFYLKRTCARDASPSEMTYTVSGGALNSSQTKPKLVHPAH